MTFEEGDIVRASGEGNGGTFKVLRIRKNGDVDVYGGLGGHLGIQNTVGHAQYRTFKPEKLRKVKSK